MQTATGLVSASIVTVNQKVVICCSYKATCELYINNATTYDQAVVLAAQTMTSLCIGNYYGGGYPWIGKVAYVAIFDGTHTAAQRTWIMQSLGTKFGITVTV